jgi:hypothetical protein
MSLPWQVRSYHRDEKTIRHLSVELLDFSGYIQTTLAEGMACVVSTVLLCPCGVFSPFFLFSFHLSRGPRGGTRVRLVEQSHAAGSARSVSGSSACFRWTVF